jgi:CheY-like chemotaxis protein
VADDGLGMDEETLAGLFEPFMQAAQALDRSRGGLGLGLALVKGLVELHGGSVSARSPGPGQGAEFKVLLPLEAGAVPGPGAAGARPAAAGRRILVIEDNRDAAHSLRDVLKFYGHQAVVAYDGPGGLALARTFRPDAVLCDIGLPGMSGFEVAQAFRADPELRGIFLVALSGYARDEDRRRAQEAGFQRHLAKPPDLEQLEWILAEAPWAVAEASRP